MKRFIIYVANRLSLIISIYFSTLILAAYLFSVFESKPFSDALWWAVVTSLTIGYGDIAPVTVAGRISASIFAHIWIFGIIPMLVANVIMHLINDKNEFSDAEQKAMFEKLESIEKKLERKRRYLRD